MAARSPSRTLCTLGLLAILAIAPAPAIRGQEPPPAPPATERDLAAELEEVESRVATARERLGQLTGSAEGTGSQDSVDPESARVLRQEVDLLERLRQVLRNQQKEEERQAALEAERLQIEMDIAAEPMDRAIHPPPFSIDELDDVLDQIAALERSRASREDTVQAHEDALKEAQAKTEDRRRELRQAEEALAKADAASAALRRRDLQLINLESRLAAEQARLLEAQLANDRADLELGGNRLRLLLEKTAWIRSRVAAGEAAEREVLLRLESEDGGLEQEIGRRRLQVEQAESRWERAQRTVGEGDPAGGARLDASRAAVTSARQHLDLLEDRRQRLILRREAWELRFRLLRGEISDREELSAAQDRLSEIASGLERESRRRASQLEDTRTTLVSLEAQLDEERADQASARWLGEHRELIRELATYYEEDLRRLGRELARVQRPRAQVEAELAEADFGERLGTLWSHLVGFLDYEILAADGSSITVGKVAGAILLVILGLWVSRRLSVLLARRVLGRFRLEEGAVAAVQSLTFYLLLLAFFLWALRTVNIPLTVFTFLGGAVAIGVGFGSQNIINNFMSGLILMIERPVKVGDLIEIEGTSGRVEHIGARSTRVRSGDNTHLILPNSSLLESTVLNWTLSDNVIRTRVDVGVAYGSDLDAVWRHLDQALREAGRILEHPAPEVLFLDFGDNALTFRALFWTRVRQPLDQLRAQSEVRLIIDRRFREADICIAFPQRDVHLDGAGPLEVRLLKNVREEP